MAEIPEELLLVEILQFLPVLSLLRFRCVSKRWRDLIDSPDFVKSHLNRSKNSSPALIFLEKTPCAYYMDLDSVCNASSPPILKEVAIPEGRDVPHNKVSVCKGLLCIYRAGRNFVLWNPSTGKHVQVPVPHHINTCKVRCWGFGCDSESDDYKFVVGIRLYMNSNVPPGTVGVWVYSLKSGLWRRIADFPCIYSFRWQRGVFVNGALHWAGYPKVIFALDLVKLQWNRLPLPDCWERKGGVFPRLMGLDGCLCATYLDLWIMKEYGVEECWSRLLTQKSTPLAYTQNGKELLLVDEFNNLMLYEFETELFKITAIKGSRNLGKPLVYIPSLVCPIKTAANSDAAAHASVQNLKWKSSSDGAKKIRL